MLSSTARSHARSRARVFAWPSEKPAAFQRIWPVAPLAEDQFIVFAQTDARAFRRFMGRPSRGEGNESPLAKTGGGAAYCGWAAGPCQGRAARWADQLGCRNRA